MKLTRIIRDAIGLLVLPFIVLAAIAYSLLMEVRYAISDWLQDRRAAKEDRERYDAITRRIYSRDKNQR